ncbi:MAG: TonB-dependent receptor [Cyclobacteriaceae bacterium]
MKEITLKFFICCLLGTVSFCGYAQTITIKNNETGEPVPGATLLSDNAFATTNAHGQVDISDFSNDEEIVIRSVGYKPTIVSYTELVANSSLDLEPASFNLEELVVSATKWRQVSGDVPAKIASITPEQIALQNPQTAADLLGVSGKVFIQKSQQGGGSPMIRGFATNRLLYTVDGVRMNTAIFRGGNLQNVINLDPFATQSTEVLFGPGSVIYGSDAVGGVMNFQTLTPQFSLDEKALVSGKAVTRYATANNEQTGHFDVNIGLRKWAFVTSVSSWNYDHLRQGSNGPADYVKPYYVRRRNGTDEVVNQSDPLLQIPTAYSQINVMQKARFQPNKNWDFEYGFHYSETSPYGRYDRHNIVRNGTARYGEWNYGPQKWMMNNLSMTHSGRSFYNQMTIRLAQQSFEESRIDRALNDTERNTQAENVQAYSVNIDFTKSLSTKHRVNYGLEYVLNDVTSTGKVTDISDGSSVDGPARYPESSWQSMGAYLNDQHKFSDQVMVQAGLRYNQFLLDAAFSTEYYPFPFTSATINKGSLTGSIGAVYRPSDSWILSTNFGTAFRSPNVDDVGKVFDSEPGTVTVPNPNLEAEYAYNLDIDVGKVFGEFAKIDVTAFYTILNNAMVRRDFTLNGQDSIQYDGELSQVQAIQNAAIAKVYGLQVGVEINLPGAFIFSSDLNFQKGREELDDGSKSPSRHAAPIFGVTRLTYATNKLDVQLYATYQGQRTNKQLAQEERGKTEIYALDANGDAYAPSWYTLNLKGQYQIKSFLSASAGIENITDQRYRPYSSGMSGAGRNFILSVTAKF